MLCAKYDYKMDIAVKQEEAYEDGLNAGVQKTAVENAKNLLKMNILNFKQISQAVGLTIEEVQKLADEIQAQKQ